MRVSDELRVTSDECSFIRHSSFVIRHYDVRPVVICMALLMILYAPIVAWACPMCAEALFSPGEVAAQSRVAQGYAVSLVVLLGTPLLLIGGLIALIVRASRHSHRS